jgi:hypothetical protein
MRKDAPPIARWLLGKNLEMVLVSYKHEEEPTQRKAIILGDKVPRDIECPCGCGEKVLVDQKKSHVIEEKRWWERKK